MEVHLHSSVCFHVVVLNLYWMKGNISIYCSWSWLKWEYSFLLCHDIIKICLNFKEQSSYSPHVGRSVFKASYRQRFICNWISHFKGVIFIYYTGSMAAKTFKCSHQPVTLVTTSQTVKMSQKYLRILQKHFCLPHQAFHKTSLIILSL
jgi:hypothetical protein